MRLPLNAIPEKKRPVKMALIAAALGLYFLFGIGLIAQKPGLQYDEAMLIAGTVHMQHSPAVFELENTPHAWICPFHHCIPLMSFLYVGPVKEYVSLPFFAIFGPHTVVVRLVALLLGAVCIWGVFVLVEPWFGIGAATASAMVLAVNPAFLNMTIFDNGACGTMMAALGLAFAGVRFYGMRKSPLAAFVLGAAIGFGVWSRANFVWIMAAGAISAVIVFRRRVLIPVSHAAAIVAGGIVGGFPFLLYQLVSRGATWKAQGSFPAGLPMATLLRLRAGYFADILLSDGEHRGMWNGPPMPDWQLWLFPVILILACLVCLAKGQWQPGAAPEAGAASLSSGSGPEHTERQSFTRFLVLTVIFSAAFPFFTRMQVAEHHLVMLLPLAVVVVVLACSILQARFRRAWAISAVVVCLYGSSAVYWQVQAMRGLSDSGGVGVWSNAGTELATYLDRNYSGRELRIVDWGLQYNMYVLTDGRLKAKEIWSQMAGDTDFDGRPWIDEIREGGVFLLNGPDNRQFPRPSAGFLRALSVAHPVMKVHNVQQRSGLTYAEVIDITPNSIQGSATVADSPQSSIEMNTRQYDSRLNGFYPPESAGFRWTKREFSARLSFSKSGGSAELVMHLYVPDSTIRQLGPVTLTTTINGHPLAPEKWSHAGQYVFRRELNAGVIVGGEAEINFSLDRVLPPSDSDHRELGIVVQDIAIEPQGAL
jgi:hypothetical protein